MNERMRMLTEAGVSVWLDDLSRTRLTSGSLAGLIREYGVSGVTTNPTIFAAALAEGTGYDQAIDALRRENVTVAEAVTRLTTSDVRDACDLFAGVFSASGGVDGRVSIEVEPGLAMDTEGTIAQARDLHQRVGRENVLIKIPATRPGLAAITATIAAGISVNVTLIFSVARYVEVVDAYLTGLEQAAAAGLDLSRIHSVASIFVSRLDTEVDKRLGALGGAASALKGKLGIANSQLAYAAWAEQFATARFAALRELGAHRQRPLWASTGVKSDAYPDTLYVSGLVAPDVVNTMPEKTLLAFADHGELGAPVIGSVVAATETMRQLAVAGIDFEDVFAVLEQEGVEKFTTSWDELVQTVEKALAG
jgi:transaldolase